MKTIWFCVLLFLLSIVPYGWFPDVPNSSGQWLVEVPAAASIAADPPPLSTPVGAIALGASSDGPAPGSTSNANQAPVDLSTYVFWHKTWDENFTAPPTAGLNVPWRWLRIYAVTQKPSENR